MIKTKKIFIALSIVALLFISAGPSYSANDPLPWLNFGNNLIWDSNNSTLTNDPSVYVTSVRYLDNSAANIYSGDPVLANIIFSPFSIDPVAVDLSISFNGIDDDYLKLLATDGSGITWFSANLDVSGPAPGLSTGLQNYLIKSNGLSVASSAGSRWADEFSSIIDLSATNPAVLGVSWNGISSDNGNGVYQINAFSKLAAVSVVPEFHEFAAKTYLKSVLAVRRKVSVSTRVVRSASE